VLNLGQNNTTNEIQIKEKLCVFFFVQQF